MKLTEGQRNFFKISILIILLFCVNYRGLGGGDLLIIYSSNSAWYFHLGYSMLNFSFKNFMTGQLEREK